MSAILTLFALLTAATQSAAAIQGPLPESVQLPPRLAASLAAFSDPLTLELPVGGGLRVRLGRLQVQGPGSRVLLGSVEGEPGAHAIFSSVDGVAAGLLQLPGYGYLEFRPKADGTHALKRWESLEPGACRAEGAPDAFPTAAFAGGSGSSFFGTASGCFPTPPDTVVDLLVLATDAAVAQVGGLSVMRALVNLRVAEMNMALQNSALDVQVRLVHFTTTPYAETGNISSDLNNLRLGVTANSAAARAAWGADLVAKVVSSRDGVTRGAAYVKTVMANYQQAYSVIMADANPLLLAHELGHNFGGDHEAAHNGNLSIHKSFSYGWHFSAAGQRFHDVMSYSPDAVVPYFSSSNPAVRYLGAALGDATHDNARVISLTASDVAAYRTPSGGNLPPSLAFSAPADGAVIPAGGALNAQVTASDPDGSVVQVDYYLDECYLGSSSTPPFSFSTSQLPPGPHVLSAVAMDSSGASAPACPPLNITVGSSLGAPWEQADLGQSCPRGSSVATGGGFSLKSFTQGADASPSGLHFMHQRLCGDGQITVRINAISRTSDRAQAGVAIFQSLDDTSPFAATYLGYMSGGASVALHLHRDAYTMSAPGGSAAILAPFPGYVRITRAGSLFSSHYSSDGVNWTLLGSSSPPLTSNAYIGIFSATGGTYSPFQVLPSIVASVDSVSISTNCPDTPTPTATPTASPSPSLSPSASFSPSSSPSPSGSPSPSPSPSAFPPSSTPTPSPSPSSTGSRTWSPTASPSPTFSPSGSPSRTPTGLASASPSPTASPSGSRTPSPSATASRTPSPPPSLSPSPTRSPSPSPMPSPTPSAPATASAGGAPLIAQSLPVPHPQSGPVLSFAFKLEAPAEEVELSLYSPAMALELRASLRGSFDKGWNRASFQAGPLANGLHYYVLRAGRGSKMAPAFGPARLYLMR